MYVYKSYLYLLLKLYIISSAIEVNILVFALESFRKRCIDFALLFKAFNGSSNFKNIRFINVSVVSEDGKTFQ